MAYGFWFMVSGLWFMFHVLWFRVQVDDTHQHPCESSNVAMALPFQNYGAIPEVWHGALWGETVARLVSLGETNARPGSRGETVSRPVSKGETVARPVSSGETNARHHQATSQSLVTTRPSRHHPKWTTLV